MVAEPNMALRAARERTPSRLAPGEGMSRREVAEAVNAFLWETTGRRYGLDAHYLAKIELGVVRWPTAPYRAGLRAVLGAGSDLELGFRPPQRAGTAPAPYPRPPLRADPAEAPWAVAGIAAEADELTGADLLNRREALTGAAVLTGTALTGPLQRWLEPLTEVQAGAGSTFTPAEVEALERLVGVFRGWSRSPGGGLARGAVVGQFRELSGRLRGAPAGPLTARAFLAGAELAKIAGSMSFDAGIQRGAQRYYVTAVQMAKAAGVDSFAAVALAALARQLYDLGEPVTGWSWWHWRSTAAGAVPRRGCGRCCTPERRGGTPSRGARTQCTGRWAWLRRRTLSGLRPPNRGGRAAWMTPSWPG